MKRKCLIFILILVMLVPTIPLPEKVSAASGITVTFINVGIGDAALIECEGKTLLIDAGPRYKSTSENSSSGEDYYVVRDFLKRKGITHLDYIIATHPHADHIGGFIHIMESGITIGTAYTYPYFDESFFSSGTSKKFERYIEEQNIRHIVPKRGSSFTLGTSSSAAKIKFLSNQSASHSLVNDYSLVCRITYGNSSFLFTGDIQSDGIADLIQSGYDLKSDVFKLPHHGGSNNNNNTQTKGTTTKPLTTKVKARYGIISRLTHLASNSYMVWELGAYGSVYQTNDLGNIVLKSDGINITVNKKASNPPVDFVSVASYTDIIKLIKLEKLDTYYRCTKKLTLNFKGKCGVDNYKKIEYMIVPKGKTFSPNSKWTTGSKVTISKHNFQGRVYVRYTDLTGRKVIMKTTGFTIDTVIKNPTISTSLAGLGTFSLSTKTTYKLKTSDPISFYFAADWGYSPKQEIAYKLVKKGVVFSKGGNWTVAQSFTLSRKFTGSVYVRFKDKAGNVVYRKTQGFSIK